MTTPADYRAALAELIKAAEPLLYEDRSVFNDLRKAVTGARALLAPPKAVTDPDFPSLPLGRPPTAASPQALRPVDRYTLSDYILAAWHKHGHDSWCLIADEVIAALATPEAVGVTDEEIRDLMIKHDVAYIVDSKYEGPRYLRAITEEHQVFAVVREAIARYGAAHPAPVPVGERLPRVGDCNEEGEVWVEEPGAEYALGDTGDYDWDPHRYVLRCIEERDHCHNRRYLPHWALPLPGVDA